MEGLKFYAVPASISSARNEDEKKIILFCNAAAIGVAKCFNRYNPSYITLQDFEDTILDAQICALTHISQSIGAGIAYADACGRSCAIKKFKSITKKNDMFSPLEFCNENGDWAYNSNAEQCPDDISADNRVSVWEEMRLQDKKDDIVRSSLKQLSASDMQVITLKTKKTPYKDIAKTMGCSIGAIQKRVYDIANRFERILSKNGYYSLG